MLVISEFRPNNIMISDLGRKNYRIAEWRVLSVSERIRWKKLFHLVNASRRVLIFYSLLIFGGNFYRLLIFVPKFY